jgi:hypothetical protein
MEALASMGGRSALAVVVLFLLAGCASRSVPPALPVHGENFEGRVFSEESRDLGFGFREVHRSQENPPGSFEGIGHFKFLYYRDRKLTQLGLYSIAPSGRSVIFQEGPSGDVLLFTAEGRSLRTLQKYPIAIINGFRWSDGEREVVLDLEGSKTLRLSLL